MHVRALPMICGLLLTHAILTPICGQGAETDAIPAQLAGHVFFVPVYLNNHGPFQFVVDTGATETIVTPATAKAAGIIVRSTPGIQQRGVAGLLLTGKACVTNLSVCIFDPPQALALRLDEGVNYGGILGYTFLHRFATTLDYHRNLVHFQQLAAIPGTHGTNTQQKIPFRVVAHLCFVEGQVNAGTPVNLLFDTGASEVLLTPAVAEKSRLKSTPLASCPGARLANLKQLGIGGAYISDVGAIIRPLPGSWPADV